jgi:hypothetical protein
MQAHTAALILLIKGWAQPFCLEISLF